EGLRPPLQDRVALITGAGSGIGRCFAEALAAARNDLVLLDVDARGLAETAAALSAGIATAVADVADRPALERVVAQHVAPPGRRPSSSAAGASRPRSWSARCCAPSSDAVAACTCRPPSG